jgi:hypothetical protein
MQGLRDVKRGIMTSAWKRVRICCAGCKKTAKSNLSVKYSMTTKNILFKEGTSGGLSEHGYKLSGFIPRYIE